MVTNDSRREGNKALRARVHHVVSLTWHRCQLFAEIAGKRTKHPFAGRAKECTDTLGEGRQFLEHTATVGEETAWLRRLQRELRKLDLIYKLTSMNQVKV